MNNTVKQRLRVPVLVGRSFFVILFLQGQEIVHVRTRFSYQILVHPSNIPNPTQQRKFSPLTFGFRQLPFLRFLPSSHQRYSLVIWDDTGKKMGLLYVRSNVPVFCSLNLHIASVFQLRRLRKVLYFFGVAHQSRQGDGDQNYIKQAVQDDSFIYQKLAATLLSANKSVQDPTWVDQYWIIPYLGAWIWTHFSNVGRSFAQPPSEPRPRPTIFSTSVITFRILLFAISRIQ